MQYIGEREIGQLTLHTYYGGDNVLSYLYEDAGEGYEYEKGIYNRKTFKTNSAQDTFRLSLRMSGHYEPSYNTYKIVVHGLPFAPGQVLINEKIVENDLLHLEENSWIVIVDSETFLSLELKK